MILIAEGINKNTNATKSLGIIHNKTNGRNNSEEYPHKQI